MNFKKLVSLLAVCMLMAFTTVALAAPKGPVCPISSAQRYAGSDNTGWKYGSSSYYAATFYSVFFGGLPLDARVFRCIG